MSDNIHKTILGRTDKPTDSVAKIVTDLQVDMLLARAVNVVLVQPVTAFFDRRELGEDFVEKCDQQATKRFLERASGNKEQS